MGGKNLINKKYFRKIAVMLFSLMYLFTVVAAAETRPMKYYNSKTTASDTGYAVQKAASDDSQHYYNDESEPQKIQVPSETMRTYSNDEISNHNNREDIVNFEPNNDNDTNQQYFSDNGTLDDKLSSKYNSNLAAPKKIQNSDAQNKNIPRRLENERLIRTSIYNINKDMGINSITSPRREAGMLQSNSARLLYIEMNGGDFKLGFSPDVNEYWLGVPSFLKYINMYMEKEDPDAEISVNGEVIDSDYYEVPVNSSVNSIAINVKAQDGTVNTYIIHLSYVDLTINKNIISTNADNDVTLTLKGINGTPIAGKDISIENYSDILKQGKTDENGNFTATINSEYSGEFIITIMGYSYYGLLFAAGPEEGVIEVTAKDRMGNDFYNFSLETNNNYMSWGTTSQGYVARVLAHGNETTIQITNNEYLGLNNESYYITKQVDIKAGEVNHVVFDAASSNDPYKELNIEGFFNGNPISNDSIMIRKTDDANIYWDMYVGHFDGLGFKKIFVSPGIYKLTIETRNEEGKRVCFMEDGIQAEEDTNKTINFTSDDIGMFRLDVTGTDNVSIENKYVSLNGSWIYMGNENELLIKEGTYDLSTIYFSNVTNNVWQSYYFTPPDNQRYITVNSGVPVVHTLDLAPADLELEMFDNMENLKPWEYAHFRVRLTTVSGHDFSWSSGIDTSMNVTITRPDGKVKNIGKYNFNYGYYVVQPDDPGGTYTVTASGDLGVIYGQYSVSNTFTVAERPRVSLNTQIVKVFTSNDVTITVEDAKGNPIPNQRVELTGDRHWYGERYTDPDGKVYFTINPTENDSINIYTCNYEYRQKLFAVDENTGVVEVSIKDVSGNDIYGFGITLRNQGPTSDAFSEGAVVRALAPAGQNVLSIYKSGGSGEDSYFIAKTIEVIAESMTSDLVDCSKPESQVAKAELNFNFDSKPIDYCDIYLEKTDTAISGKTALNRIGKADENGSKIVYVLPGSYKVRIMGKTEQGKGLRLAKSGIVINSNSGINCDWETAGTGEVQLNYTGISYPILKRGIAYDKIIVFLDDYEKDLITNKGSYSVSGIGIRTQFENREITYNYNKSSNLDTLTIGDQPSIYNADLGIKEVNLNIYSSEIHPEDRFSFGANILTNSGYNLNSISSYYSSMHLFLHKPDGSVEDMGEHWTFGSSYPIQSNAQIGQYRIEGEVDLGPAYGKWLVSRTFNVTSKYPKPNISIDDSSRIMKTGIQSEITVALKSNDGSPMAGVPLSFNGPDFGINGVTDSNGEYILRCTPYTHGYVDINAGGYLFSKQLFAIYEDEGVIRATSKDMQGNALNNLYIRASSQKMSWSGRSSQNIAMTIAKEGTNELTAVAYNDQDYYYAFKNISVQKGIINDITVDMRYENIVRSDLKFTFDGITADGDNNNICIRKTDNLFNNKMVIYTGNTNLGIRSLYITPGSYDVIYKGMNNENTPMHLVKQVKIGTISSSYLLNWGTGDVSEITLGLTGLNIPITRKSLYLDGVGTDYGESNKILLDRGIHQIEGISIQTVENNEQVSYDYWNYGSNNIITFDTPEKTLDFDLGLKNISLMVDPNKVKPNQNVNYWVELVTNSGYVMDWSDKYIGMDVQIIDPNNNTSYYWQYFRDGSYWVPYGAPDGEYKIKANIDFSPLYGQYNLEGSFSVFSKPNIAVNKDFVFVGEETDVTITLTDNDGNPVEGSYVEVIGFGSGYTDASGQITVKVNPTWSNNMTIRVNNYYYDKLLFAITHDEGLVDVRLKDINGNDLDDFRIEVFSDYMGWGRYSEAGSAKAVAYKGKNLIAVIKNGYENGDGYYIMKNYDVIPGTLNTVIIDASDPSENLVRASLNLSYNGKALDNTRVHLENMDAGLEYLNEQIGITDGTGSKIVYVTPGIYRVSIDSENINGEKMYLSKELVIDKNGDCNIVWDNENTGIVNMNFLGVANSEGGTIVDYGIELDGQWAWTQNAKRLILNKGDHTIREIELEVSKGYGDNLYYDYGMPGDNPYTFTVGNISNDLNMDLSISDMSFNMYRKVICSGQIIEFEIQVETKSGFRLLSIDGMENDNMHVRITKPDGAVQEYNQYHTDGSYVSIEGDPDGKYMIEAAVNLGFIYGANAVFNLSDKFYISNSDELKILDTMPGNDEHNVPITNYAIVLIVNKDISGAYWGRIVVTDNMGNPIDITEMYNSNIGFQLILGSNLQYGKTYTVKVQHDALEDYSGQTLAADYEFSFTTEPRPDVKFGDVNGDNNIDYTDSSNVKSYILNKDNLLTEDGKAAADVDGDGKITSTDYALIMRYLKGKITKFPIEP